MGLSTLSQEKSYQLTRRLRRNRKSESIRKLVQETRLHPSDFVAPCYVTSGTNQKIPIASLPHNFIFSIDNLIKELKDLHSKGIQAALLFPIIEKSLKDPAGSEALNPNGLIPKAIQAIKKEIPSLTIMTDIALDPYTSHGHDGLVSENFKILNDETLEVLGKQSLLHAECGVDIVAPSDMMDGRIGFIRDVLDSNGFVETSILSYSAKYASSLYKGYRDIVGSTLSFGDKLTYQLSPANAKEAILEAQEDIKEGADMLLVKPGIFYLDILAKIRQFSNIPLAAFQVGTEYTMIMAADKLGYLEGTKVLHESLISLKRAGADLIFTYGAQIILNEIC